LLYFISAVVVCICLVYPSNATDIRKIKTPLQSM
jgi:hypothetical protein